MLFCSVSFYLPPSAEAPLQIVAVVSWQQTALTLWRKVDIGLAQFCSPWLENILTSSLLAMAPEDSD